VNTFVVRSKRRGTVRPSGDQPTTQFDQRTTWPDLPFVLGNADKATLHHEIHQCVHLCITPSICSQKTTRKVITTAVDSVSHLVIRGGDRLFALLL
jgi:hypothetical protein